ncbi:endonuclease-reverse transcriptase [Plakobranchus ocellatus]|uniref:Endonuclease-reverse transcriptase n=1 Tax=Plakobranchus ocellatus TaxID=259542 RepID=A0AAV4BEF9_9GAST|nr:endonuclease-reverse transcriptase [Plakobranchus ocellatus]
MSSPSKRSTRLSKLDQPQDTKSMDRKQGQVAKLKAGEEKVGTNTPEKSKQKSFIELPKNENSNQKSKSDEMVLVPQTMTTKGSLKKGKAQQALPTPLSAVRRSGRAPVPSSRYKDMEVETPGTSRKRSTMAESSSKEPKVEQEPSKKRFKTLR